MCCRTEASAPFQKWKTLRFHFSKCQRARAVKIVQKEYQITVCRSTWTMSQWHRHESTNALRPELKKKLRQIQFQHGKYKIPKVWSNCVDVAESNEHFRTWNNLMLIREMIINGWVRFEKAMRCLRFKLCVILYPYFKLKFVRAESRPLPRTSKQTIKSDKRAERNYQSESSARGGPDSRQRWPGGRSHVRKPSSTCVRLIHAQRKYLNGVNATADADDVDDAGGVGEHNFCTI